MDLGGCVCDGFPANARERRILALRVDDVFVVPVRINDRALVLGIVEPRRRDAGSSPVYWS